MQLLNFGISLNFAVNSVALLSLQWPLPLSDYWHVSCGLPRWSLMTTRTQPLQSYTPRTSMSFDTDARCVQSFQESDGPTERSIQRHTPTDTIKNLAHLCRYFGCMSSVSLVKNGSLCGCGRSWVRTRGRCFFYRPVCHSIIPSVDTGLVAFLPTPYYRILMVRPYPVRSTLSLPLCSCRVRRRCLPVCMLLLLPIGRLR